MSTKEKRDCVRRSVPRVVDFIVKGRVYRASIENTKPSQMDTGEAYGDD